MTKNCALCVFFSQIFFLFISSMETHKMSPIKISGKREGISSHFISEQITNQIYVLLARFCAEITTNFYFHSQWRQATAKNIHQFLLLFMYTSLVNISKSHIMCVHYVEHCFWAQNCLHCLFGDASNMCVSSCSQINSNHSLNKAELT